MRQQSRKQIRIRGVVVGGPLPLICLPLVAESGAELIDQAAGLAALKPDLIEWRADGFGAVEDVAACLSALGELRRTIGEIPLIFTCRIDQEGGMRTLAQGKRLEVIVAAITSGTIDLVDIELCNGPEFIDAVRKHTQAHRVALILSYHNFKETPDETFICNKLLAAWQAGADIPKLAVMPKDYGDVLILLGATNKARNSAIDSPIRSDTSMARRMKAVSAKDTSRSSTVNSGTSVTVRPLIMFQAAFSCIHPPSSVPAGVA